MTLLIGTPAYGNKLHTGYLHTVLELGHSGVPFSVFTIGNESLITRARNSILGYFNFHRTLYSHLLFLDADVQLSAAHIKHMLELEKDVVGAPVPLKGRSKENKAVFNVGLEMAETELPGVFKTDYIGTAVLLLSRAAVDSLVDLAATEGRLYKNDGRYLEEADWTRQPMHDVFRVGLVDGHYYSEDFWVCKELRELGYDIFVDSNVAVTHHGDHPFMPD